MLGTLRAELTPEQAERLWIQARDLARVILPARWHELEQADTASLLIKVRGTPVLFGLRLGCSA